MRRTAIALTLVALVLAGLYACSADAPTAPKPGNGGGGTGNSALTIQLFTSDANPKAGTCTLVQAIVSLNGNPIPDGSTVNFTTDFGTFSQNGLPLVSVVTQNGSAVTAVCGPGAGLAKVHAQATVQGQTGNANISIVFQPDSGTLPFVSSCSPSFGPKEGGTVLTLNGGRFFGSTSTTRVTFTVNGTTREGVVQSVSANSVTVLTPGFSEFGAPTLPAQVTLVLGTNQLQPVSVSLPNCFSFGAASSSTPTVSAILPSSGTTEGNTRVTIVGSGFSSNGVQVFFGTKEANVVSVNYNQIVVLSPRHLATDPLVASVTVKNINSGAVSNGVNFTYGPPVTITAINNNVQPAEGPFTALTIYGTGFQAPVAVTLAGWGAQIVSVSATEIVVIPGPVVITNCNDVTGAVRVVNINSGDGVTSNDVGFTYSVAGSKPLINSIAPGSGDASSGTFQITISGSHLASVNHVTIGSRTATINSQTDTQIVVTVPPNFAAPPTCDPGNLAGTEQKSEEADVTVTTEIGCSATVSKGFVYFLPCVVQATPTP